MTQKLLQHCWSHFLRDLLNRCLQFHSYLCHHAGCFPTVAFPSEFQGLQKQKKEEEKTKTNQAPMHPSQKKKEYLQMENGTIMPILMEKLPNIATKTCRKFLRSVYCKPQAAFLGCVLTGPGPTRSWSKWFLISTIQHHNLSYYILCYSCIMLLVSSHISNSVAGSRSIWKKDTGSTEAGFSHLL